MLYKKNSEKTLSKELFENPSSEYRGTPFWAWNSLLKKDELLRQIDIFKEMGLGGFHMHVRTGLENKYLGDEFMELIRSCVDKAKDENMLAWLYDEDRWPSGAAGGFVTENHDFRQRSVSFSPDYEASVKHHNQNAENPDEDNDIKLLTCYDIVLDDEGYLLSYKRIGKDDTACGKKWYLFLDIETPSSWYNDKTYIDTLNPTAVDKFIKITHERYKECVGDEFGKTVPAIFTDEPQVYKKQKLCNSFDCNREIHLPWTDAFPQEYKKRYNADIFDYLPETVWQLPESTYSPHRYYYHNLIGDIFASSFAENIGRWCDDNGIAFTGHMMEEPTLESQTHSLSEAMRSYGYFGIPGIDMLCNSTEFTTAKQCQSAVHQFGKEAMLSELYGVTAWDCDFRTYKFGGDWQAALGVTVRVPHLSWYAMQGEAKRDYPASIGYQSPWWNKFNVIENHFARLNTALTRGKPVVKVGVIHPIESFWLHYGPNDKTEIFRKQLEEQFSFVTDWLLEGSIDFDFISEALLPELNEGGCNPFKVGCMQYDAVVVPGCETLRETTLSRLEEFGKQGGKLIFMGNAPKYIDALVCDKAVKLWNESIKIGFTRAELLSALEDNRTVTIRKDNGLLTYDILHQLRADTDCNWLFVCHGSEPDNKDVSTSEKISIIVKGEYKAEIWNTDDGSVSPANTIYRNGDTVIDKELFSYESLLLKLIPGKSEVLIDYPSSEMDNAGYVIKCEDYSLDEDNVFLLDIAEYAVDFGPFNAEDEILRLDNKARHSVGLRERGGSVAQPWAVKSEAPSHTVSLRFCFISKIDYIGADLALEDADKAVITFNGKSVNNDICGYFVDKTISRIHLPQINKGLNILEVTLPLGERTNTENMFILGKFGVELCGRKAKITAMPQNIDFGNLTSQGFPFYGGNVIYKFKAMAHNGKMSVKVNNYRGTLTSIFVDGKERGDIIYPPYELDIDSLSEGLHDVAVKLYLHRYNCFGPLHMTEVNHKWHGPGAWRTVGDSWSYEYILRQTGLLTAPRIK